MSGDVFDAETIQQIDPTGVNPSQGSSVFGDDLISAVGKPATVTPEVAEEKETPSWGSIYRTATSAIDRQFPLFGAAAGIGASVVNPFLRTAGQAGARLLQNVSPNIDPEAVGQSWQIPVGPLASEVEQAIGRMQGAPFQFINRIPGMQTPLGQTALEVGQDVLAGSALYGMTRGLSAGEMGEGIQQGHPLSEAAQGEADRLDQIRARGEAAGLEIAPRNPSAQVQIVNAIGRDELKLPANAPLTDKMIDIAERHYVSPAYEAIRNEPAVTLDKTYSENMARTVGESDAEFLPKNQPPSGGTISGSDAINSLKRLQQRARAQYGSYKISKNPDALSQAQLYDDAAEELQDAMERSFTADGKGDLVSNLQAARVYNAKAESVRHALDGGGNIRATDLGQQLRRRVPLSGGLEDIATLAREAPDAFSTQPARPAPGVMRRAAAFAAPPGGALLGGLMGGPFGGLVGEEAGRNLAQRLISSGR